MSKHKCPYSTITDEDMDALSWLNSLVARGAQMCDPKAKQFHAAHNAMGKLLKRLNAQHDLLHAKDAELQKAEAITTGLLGLSPAVRENGDLN